MIEISQQNMKLGKIKFISVIRLALEKNTVKIFKNFKKKS